MKKWLFNPFIYVAGGQALLVGCVIMAVTAAACYFSKAHFDGVLDLHVWATAKPLYIYFMEAVIDWGLLSGLLYLGGLFFSRSSIRFIDVVGTQALARWPMLPAAFIGFGLQMPRNMPGDVHKMRLDELKGMISGSVIFFGMLELLCTVLMVALMYQAFSISCNLKGGKSAGIFIAGLLIAEILSKNVLGLIYSYLI